MSNASSAFSCPMGCVAGASPCPHILILLHVKICSVDRHKLSTSVLRSVLNRWCVCVCVCVQLQLRLTLCDPMDCSLPGFSMRFSRQEYYSGWPCPPPGDILNPGIEPMSPVSPALQADSLPLSHWGNPNRWYLPHIRTPLRLSSSALRCEDLRCCLLSI